MKYHVSRCIIIDAPLEKVRPHVADFKQWEAWSPWSIVEPDHESKVEGKPGEVGSLMYWNGEVIGEGQMTIEKVKGDRFYHKLEFFKPFKSKADASFILEKVGEKQTKVTWTMDSSMPFFLFFMVKMMKSWIEMDYDRGLAMLKEVVEKGKINAKTANDGVIDFEGFSYVGISKTSSMESMPKEMSECFETLVNDLGKNQAKAKKWVSIYTKMNVKEKSFTYIVAASDEELQGKELGENYVKGNIESGKMVKITHKGSYRFLGNAWSMGMMYARAKKMKQKGKPFEFYVNNPQDTKEEDLITEVYFPIK